MKRATLILAALFSFSAGAAWAQTEETVTIPGRHRISVLVPPGYSFRVERDSENNAAVYMENPVWMISITAYIIADPDPAITTADWQRNHLITRVASVMPESKEKDYSIRPFYPSSGSGVFCVFTDGNYTTVEQLPPGEFLNLTDGVKAWRGCYIYFRIMSNSVTSAEYREAFELFETSFTK